jgi:hypothetical protein
LADTRHTGTSVSTSGIYDGCVHVQFSNCCTKLYADPYLKGSALLYYIWIEK